jgi:hypothetical protein
MTNSTIINEIYDYFNNAKIPEFTTSQYAHIATDSPNASLFLKALNSGLSPNTIFKANKYPSCEDEINLIGAFFISASLKELKQEEKLFKENMNNPTFEGLLFIPDIVSAKAKMADKIKYLLDLGYNPNVIATPEMYINKSYFHYNGDPEESINLTPLYYCDNKKTLQYLLEAGADLNIKATIVGFQETYENVSPMEFAKKRKEKGKLVLLEKYNKAQTPKQKVEEIKLLWNAKKRKEAFGKFSIEMKNENEALFDSLLEFKDLILMNHNRNNMVSQMIYNQQIKWLEKVFDNKISNDSFRGHSDWSYIHYAANKHKTQTFIYLYEKGLVSGLEDFIASTTETINHFKDEPNILTRDFNGYFPILIVDYLINQGYEFGGQNKAILEKIITKEKEKLESMLIQGVKTNKKVKM